MARGKLILVIGSTGSGKSSLIRHATEHFPELAVLDSYTTRQPRPNHVENDHYRFVSADQFEGMIETGDFLEWARFSDNYYGTRKADVTAAIEAGKVVIKEMEVQGVRQVKELLPPEDVISVFINGGTWEEIAARAVKRDPLSADELERRKVRFDDEITFMSEADVVINNFEGKKEEADLAFETVIQNALGK